MVDTSARLAPRHLEQLRRTFAARSSRPTTPRTTTRAGSGTRSTTGGRR